VSVDLKQRLAALRRQGGLADTLKPASEIPPPSMKDRLERLNPGGRKHLSDQELAERLGGEVVSEGLLLIEQFFPISYCHGDAPLGALLDASLGMLAEEGEPRPEGLLFLDTETSGLAGGTGTLAFLLGLARFEGGALRVRQFFLTGFKGEQALLSEAIPWLKDAEHFVTFNGKCFDIPLLAGRYRLARQGDPLAGAGHIDLLHPTRAAFGALWPDCRLQTAERRLLNFHRADDLPGHMVPQAWFDFVRQGVLHQVLGILEHNRWDLVSLAGLAAALARVYAEPDHRRADVLAVARAHLRRGREEDALRHLAASEAYLDEPGLLELAALRRRKGDWQETLRLWEWLAERGSVEAMERLAKYHEHVARDYGRALSYAEALLARRPGDHGQRAARLAGKIARQGRQP
jgi:uncharacterized protein YprB with RNaseH-like and TPR domain